MDNLVKVSIDDEKPESHRNVVLWHRDQDAPPTIGWATYWQPKNEFAGFELQCQHYEDDFGKDFTHWAYV
ncbi:hypothetical protein C4G84_RS14320 [Vibrio parahaemolyticus O5:K30]|uniref:hypothetical protein n=1 Tax=Vibrio vulnificus TaxID=672 RepID=UPI003D9CB582|nr:hypothetical protein [Vibrio parahaemolyticus O5:K30]